MARFLVISALSGFLAVAIGAFGAHAFQDLLVGKRMAWLETAQQYHFVHTVALLAICALAGGSDLSSSPAMKRGLAAAAWAFLLGMGLFSGILYVMAFSGRSALVGLVPVGGLFFLLGWLALMFVGVCWWRASKTAG